MLRFFDFVRFSQVYCSVDPQKYLASYFLCLYLVLWVFHVEVKWFWCTHTTRESQVCQHKFLAKLCHFFTPGLIFTCPIPWWDIFLSALWGYGCAAHCRCVLSVQVVFVFFMCPVTFSSDFIIGCSTSWGRLLPITIFFSFRIEGRQTTRTQNNSKDQFEMDLIMLLTPFPSICSLDDYWPSYEVLSQPSSSLWRNKTKPLGSSAYYKFL